METLQQVREGHRNVCKEAGDRRAVVVVTQISPRRATSGVQFWTSEQVTAGRVKNTDGTFSTFRGYL